MDNGPDEKAIPCRFVLVISVLLFFEWVSLEFS